VGKLKASQCQQRHGDYAAGMTYGTLLGTLIVVLKPPFSGMGLGIVRGGVELYDDNRDKKKKAHSD
jgi:hypothetical protein